MNAIQNLANNPAIDGPGEDPILIFYAGHGGEAPTPHPDWKTNNGMIQMLVPYDFALEGSDGHRGQGIFDITLSGLLTDIAKNKSDNIVSHFYGFRGSVLI